MPNGARHGDGGPPRVAAVVSLFHPDDAVYSHLETAASQAALLVVVDDSGNLSRNPTSIPDVPNIELIVNETNVGLAESLNRGVARALAWGADQIVTLDQDTVLPDFYVKTLSDHLRQIVVSGLPALVSAPETIRGRGYFHSHRWVGGWCSSHAVQSGLMFDARIFDVVGTFRSEFVIDGVETEFLLRAHRHNLHVSLCPGLDLRHMVGNPIAVANGRLETSQHSPLRNYYATRNTLTLIRENVRHQPRASAATFIWLVKYVGKALAFESGRREKLRAIVAGVVDFMRGRMGHRP